MTISIVPFEPYHLDRIARPLPYLFDNLDDLKAAANRPGFAFSGIDVNEVAACAGVIPLWNGVGEAWAVIPALPPGKLTAVCRAARRMLKRVIKDNKFHRVQASIRCSFPNAARFAEIIGFEYEGPLRKYDAFGNDYDRYAIFD